MSFVLWIFFLSPQGEEIEADNPHLIHNSNTPGSGASSPPPLSPEKEENLPSQVLNTLQLQIDTLPSGSNELQANATLLNTSPWKISTLLVQSELEDGQTTSIFFTLPNSKILEPGERATFSSDTLLSSKIKNHTILAAAGIPTSSAPVPEFPLDPPSTQPAQNNTKTGTLVRFPNKNQDGGAQLKTLTGERFAFEIQRDHLILPSGEPQKGQKVTIHYKELQSMPVATIIDSSEESSKTALNPPPQPSPEVTTSSETSNALLQSYRGFKALKEGSFEPFTKNYLQPGVPKEKWKKLVGSQLKEVSVLYKKDNQLLAELVLNSKKQTFSATTILTLDSQGQWRFKDYYTDHNAQASVPIKKVSQPTPPKKPTPSTQPSPPAYNPPSYRRPSPAQNRFRYTPPRASSYTSPKPTPKSQPSPKPTPQPKPAPKAPTPSRDTTLAAPLPATSPATPSTPKPATPVQPASPKPKPAPIKPTKTEPPPPPPSQPDLPSVSPSNAIPVATPKTQSETPRNIRTLQGGEP